MKIVRIVISDKKVKAVINDKYSNSSSIRWKK